MNLDELRIILGIINKKHFIEGRAIKYVNFDYDNRSRDIWRISFRHWFKDNPTIFTNTNRPIEERRPLFEEIVEWLNEG